MHRKTNLTPERSRFIGRGPQLAALRELLERGERLVTLVGPPGIGKSRLAARLAAAELEAFSEHGGAWWCDLTEVRTTAELLDSLGALLGVPLRADHAVSTLAAALGARGPTLVALDNCEYLDDAARGVLQALLDQAPEARFVATSLAGLGLESEHCLELPPLALAEASVLYDYHARRVDPGVELDRQAVEELVQQLDRNPLAIQLAASRVRRLRPRQLLARLGERFSLLRGGPPGRHESLFRAIQCSWELLSPAESSALAQCSVFAGGFTLEAAEAIVELSATADSVLDVIGSLREKALVGADAADPPRFFLLESIRHYAAGELVRSGCEAAVRRRHAAYYVGLGVCLESDAAGFDLKRRIGPERDNLLAAFRRMLPVDPTLAAQTALAIEPLLAMAGPLAESDVLDRAVAAAAGTDDPILRARTLRARGMARHRQAAYPEARADLLEALACAPGGSLVSCYARLELSRLSVIDTDFDGALRLLEEGRSEARRAGATFLEGHAELLLGQLAYHRSQHDRATEHYERARSLFRRADRPRAEGAALLDLATAHAALGHFELARMSLEQAGELFTDLGDDCMLAHAAVGQGHAELLAGNLDEAERLLVRARGLERELGRPFFEAVAAGNLAGVAFAQGRLRSALRLLDEALSIFRSSNHVRYTAGFGTVHAAVLAASGELARARAEFARAREIIDRIGNAGMLATLEIYEGILDLAAARTAPDDEAAMLVARARGLATRPPGAAPAGQHRIAVRLLERAIAGWSEATVAPAPDAPARDDRRVLRVGPEAMWFDAPGRPRCDLRRRKAMRKLLLALVEQRVTRPGIGMSQRDLFAAGWPGERAIASAAAGRVYVAINALRAAGLEEVLVRHDDGYLLGPEIAVARQDGIG